MHAEDRMIKEDINLYLEQNQNKDLLRFITCGSVDDGKSTLIGRLLHDSKMIFEDQLAAVAEDSKKVGTQGDNIDLALLVDGLQAEREQGITIDVAYRYFTTDKRKFIIADTPGHEQYTRNMVTGASNSSLAIILVDARSGIQKQTKRHSFICSLLGIKHIIVAINKMDLVNYSQEIYKQIQMDYLMFAGSLDIPDIRFVPISALNGDNVVTKSESMPWFRGSPLIHYLETVDMSEIRQLDNEFRFPVQLVCRPNSNFRGYQGTVLSGKVSVGDVVRILPSNQLTTVNSIETFDGDKDTAYSSEAITLTVTEDIDISRGDMLVHKNNLPHLSKRFRAKLVWMIDRAIDIDQSYYIHFSTKHTIGRIEKFNYKININNLTHSPCGKLELNEIGSVDIEVDDYVGFDSYQKNKYTGSFIIIDRITNNTVGAGMVDEALFTEDNTVKADYSDFEIELNSLIRKHFPHWEAKKLI